jgi:hypothetical protein
MPCRIALLAANPIPISPIRGVKGGQIPDDHAPGVASGKRK